MPYVIVRPGGMERPTDDHGRTHNVRLATRDQLFGGTVSRLQVAELVAAAVANPELAENKARKFPQSSPKALAPTQHLGPAIRNLETSNKLPLMPTVLPKEHATSYEVHSGHACHVKDSV